MLRDLAVLIILLSFLPLIFQRPWIGVLALAVFDYLNPHEYVPGFMNNFPVSRFLFATLVLATIIAVSRKRLVLRRPPLDWRLLLLAALVGWFYVTSLDAKVPWLTWTYFRLTVKGIVVIALTLLLIDTREKFFALIAVIAMSFALVAIKGGYWAFMTGFQDRVYGPPGSAYQDNNHFAVVAMMTLPLLVLLFRETRARGLRIALAVAMAACLTATLSSWSRGGLVTLSVTLLLLILYSRRKLLVLPLLLLPAAAYLLLPGKWLTRMQSLSDPESAAPGRFAIWRLGLDYLREEPWTGGGFMSWTYIGWRGGEVRDWHSAYVEMAAEHGLVGLALWGGLLLGGIAGLLCLAHRSRRGRAPDWKGDYGSMLGISLAAYAVGGISLGISYWPVFFHLVLLSAILQHLPENGQPAGVKIEPP